ncbi:MAG: acetolactate synthase, large subunit, biosynthetic type [Candidatus Schekmanbacteria bacterium RIFCSPHIGHO2_02_FULL_38_11]|uniref:Acetolactate synthase n=1 Tax=Candidatus Schekmanbacteria bacterium RIFCSPLOWO2_12_FULL_38_15 TaxID=1817883 RepID=A0A1F7SJM1_9BACT|nr:MAG: acetolactate synthase, large subunit, biosynthetic type [Candidatus Schekmanbacteria bacterium GWA2_38_9]OGL50843.1 MAG: acetolactate synthase, large subunit, biosynthetic type [Candidatus Schekmanbacteria bacterium RIFCSPLOWO2_02_FULL_38_14]OGL53397.1 MAG: acetolactate synthase, large subunit, biosynthetic type [Candidatus Schekmanbacteria bacterium RIFCSPLOWO2_12_FULL_38_15]OGL55749.1 MAG: acetolactate synthase, large subunit, biosynthetic type [Candidatus Schekmanbacteria bacterium RI
MKRKGSQVIIDTLLKQGVDTVFGYPGGQNIPIYDALYGVKDITHILTRHEQGAIHAADGYARATGKVGVVFATSGPGATNLVTGLANANMDSVPLVAVTGQVPTSMIGNDSFQEADIYGISVPITKYNYLVKDVTKLERVLVEAFHIAKSGRTGPVLVDVPRDIQTSEVVSDKSLELRLPSYQPSIKGHAKQIIEATKAIESAEKPVIYAGGGVLSSGASEELFSLAETGSIPVAMTLMGLGSFPGTHSLSLGMLGMHGTKYANIAVAEADVLIAIGTRFSDRVTGKPEHFAVNAKIIHIDIDPAEIGKIKKCHIPIVGNCKMVLKVILEKLKPNKREKWVAKLNELKKEFPMAYSDSDKVIKPQYIIEQIYEATKGNAIITTDVGQHQMWTAQYYKFENPRTLITSGGLGTMGFGFPAAIGAKIGCPKKTVVNITGDGSFQMTIQEIATAVQYKIPIKVAILNNGYLGMVRQWQELFYGGRYSETDLGVSPDFVKIAEGYRAKGILVQRKEDVKSAIAKALEMEEPVIMDFRVDREENVMPMIPPGGTVKNVLG